MRKFRLRKILAAAGALLLGFNIFLAQAEAKSSFWSSLEKVITAPSRGATVQAEEHLVIRNVLSKEEKCH